VALALGATAGGVLLVVAELSTLYAIRANGSVVKSISGHAQHAYALGLVGLVAVGMAVGALRGARPAMVALAVLGLAALLITVFFDLSDVRATGVVGQDYADASARAGAGFYEQTLGALLLLVCGVGLLVRAAPGLMPRRASATETRSE